MAAIAAASFTSYAQEGNSGLKFGAGFNAALPIGNLADISSFGAGIDVIAKYWLNENVAITGDAGYTALFGKNDFKASSVIPVRAGIQYGITPQFFLKGKAGVGFFKQGDYEVAIPGMGTIKVGGGNATTFAYSIGAGYQFSEKIDLGLSYDAYSKNGTSSLINLRIGYSF